MSAAFWAQDPTSTDPPSFTMAPEEDCTLSFDATALVVGADAPSAPTAVLHRIVDNGADAAVTLADAPQLGSGNTIQQRIRGLTAGETYRLRVLFETGGNVRAMSVVIVVTE